MTTKILCVDDDAHILAAYQRQLRKQFEIDVAQGGEQALESIAKRGPYAVILSDMRMPGMNGIQLLCRVQEIAPISVRMMLTGNADQQTAIDAVNEGNIFRFLTKPCPPDRLARAFTAGVEQYRLVVAEKVLLEKTLRGSIKVLTDILALVNPTAFGRASRLQRLVGQLACELKVEKAWELELSAMLSQVGCVAIPETVLQKVYQGQDLQPEEARMFAAHPRIAHDLIASIPRLESVAGTIACLENDSHEPNDPPNGSPASGVLLHARILRLAMDFDGLVSKGMSKARIIEQLKTHAGRYGARVLDGLGKVLETEKGFTVAEVPIEALTTNMMLAEDVKTDKGALLIGKGHEITLALRQKLKIYYENGHLSNKRIWVTVPDSSSGT